ncbi:hypothetical protein GOV09_01110 [Candidatus Woesearchaeota archaeon]|nr:hypothetical protein [Candidatus Woesearchaeota archaeon]
MFKSMRRLKKEEKWVLGIGVIFTVVIFYLINFYFTGQQLIFWAIVEAGIMWLVIISLLILADNHRILNDELKEILREHIKESKTLKEISHEELQEIKLLKKVAKEAMNLMKKKKT